MSYYSNYRWCAVPECKNTSVKTPDKLWIQVPTVTNMRKTWFKLAKRDPAILSEKSRLYFCEDHFDLEHDMENYVQYKIMGSVKRIRLKPHCIPSRFDVNRKHKSASNESHLAEAKKLRISHIEIVNVKASSRCIEDKSGREVARFDNVEGNQGFQEIQAPVPPPLPPGPALWNVQDVSTIGNMQEDFSLSENEIKVFCPKCDSEVVHTAEGIQEDQTKILIAKVYHYFEQEYEELKTIYGDLDLTPLSNFRQRTALATGVSEMKILQILKEEEERNAVKRQEPPEKRRRACKRSRQTGSSTEEASSDVNDDDSDQSSYVNDSQTLIVKEEPTEYYNSQTLVVKEEPTEYYNEEPEIYVSVPSDVEIKKEPAQTDPISLDVKTEPRNDVVDNTHEKLLINEPVGTKRKRRKTPRSDDTSTRQHTQGESSTTAAANSVRLTEELHESRLFGDTEIKLEKIDIYEEGIS